jgi:serine O-acetyltransferase
MTSRPTLRAVIMADLREQATGRRSAAVLEAFTVKGLAVVLYRAAHHLGRRVPLLGHVLKQLNHVVTGADIAWQACIGPGLILYHPTGVVIGPHVRIGARLRVQQGVTIGGDGGRAAGLGSSPTIGDDVQIGAGAKMFGPISVGDGALIGANSVVVNSVPAGRTAVGVPARLMDLARGGQAQA